MEDAKEITKIIIKGSSGYCAYSEAYKDRLTIEKGKISYEYLPEDETKINPVRKWKYTTNSPLYQTLYERIIKMLSEYLCKDPMELVMDIGGTAYGQMIIQLPEDEADAARALHYLKTVQVPYEEVNGDVI